MYPFLNQLVHSAALTTDLSACPSIGAGQTCYPIDSVRELASLFPVQGKNSPFFISSHTHRDSRLLQKGMSRIICSLRKKLLVSRHCLISWPNRLQFHGDPHPLVAGIISTPELDKPLWRTKDRKGSHVLMGMDTLHKNLWTAWVYWPKIFDFRVSRVSKRPFAEMGKKCFLKSTIYT